MDKGKRIAESCFIGDRSNSGTTEQCFYREHNIVLHFKNANDGPENHDFHVLTTFVATTKCRNPLPCHTEYIEPFTECQAIDQVVWSST